MSDRDLLQVLVDAAGEGERAFNLARGREGRVRVKSSSADLVTEVDLRVHEAVTAFLRRHVPQACVVAEEAEERAHSEERIYLDPIDATLNFVHGFGEYCISIGYWSGGDPSRGSSASCRRATSSPRSGVRRLSERGGNPSFPAAQRG